MTKEELEKEAEEYFKKHTTYDETFDMNFINVTTMQAYLDSAEPREKRIAELEATNKKISDECHKLVDTLEKKQKEIAELEKERTELVQEKYNLEYKIENLENKIEHHQEVIDTFKKENAELEQKLETERNSRIALVIKIAELEAQIEKMKCCGNCKYGYCPASSIIKKDGKTIFHNWNEERQAYCDSDKHQLWGDKRK